MKKQTGKEYIVLQQYEPHQEQALQQAIVRGLPQGAPSLSFVESLNERLLEEAHHQQVMEEHLHRVLKVLGITLIMTLLLGVILTWLLVNRRQKQELAVCPPT